MPRASHTGLPQEGLRLPDIDLLISANRTVPLGHLSTATLSPVLAGRHALPALERVVEGGWVEKAEHRRDLLDRVGRFDE